MTVKYAIRACCRAIGKNCGRVIVCTRIIGRGINDRRWIMFEVLAGGRHHWSCSDCICIWVPGSRSRLRSGKSCVRTRGL